VWDFEERAVDLRARLFSAVVCDSTCTVVVLGESFEGRARYDRVRRHEVADGEWTAGMGRWDGPSAFFLL
jgi:hypothetical protein